MRLYNLGSIMVFLGLSMIGCAAVEQPSTEEIERIGLEAQEEINLHYANTVMTGLQDDNTLQAAIDRYKEVLPSASQPLALIEEIENTYPDVSGRRCMLQTSSTQCRRYLEAVDPFIYQ